MATRCTACQCWLRSGECWYCDAIDPDPTTNGKPRAAILAGPPESPAHDINLLRAQADVFDLVRETSEATDPTEQRRLAQIARLSMPDQRDATVLFLRLRLAVAEIKRIVDYTAALVMPRAGTVSNYDLCRRDAAARMVLAVTELAHLQCRLDGLIDRATDTSPLVSPPTAHIHDAPAPTPVHAMPIVALDLLALTKDIALPATHSAADIFSQTLCTLPVAMSTPNTAYVDADILRSVRDALRVMFVTEICATPSGALTPRARDLARILEDTGQHLAHLEANETAEYTASSPAAPWWSASSRTATIGGVLVGCYIVDRMIPSMARELPFPGIRSILDTTDGFDVDPLFYAVGVYACHIASRGVCHALRWLGRRTARARSGADTSVDGNV
jgi:hypothetical protein